MVSQIPKNCTYLKREITMEIKTDNRYYRQYHTSGNIINPEDISMALLISMYQHSLDK